MEHPGKLSNNCFEIGINWPLNNLSDFYTSYYKKSMVMNTQLFYGEEFIDLIASTADHWIVFYVIENYLELSF